MAPAGRPDGRDAAACRILARIAGAAALGLVVGALVGWPERPPLPRALRVAGLLAAAAVPGFVPGLPGLWLDGRA